MNTLASETTFARFWPEGRLTAVLAFPLVPGPLSDEKCRGRFSNLADSPKIHAHKISGSGSPHVQVNAANPRVAWSYETLLVSRCGYSRREQPGPRQIESIFLRARIREELMRCRQTYGSPRLARLLGCPERRNRVAGRLLRTVFKV